MVCSDSGKQLNTQSGTRRISTTKAHKYVLYIVKDPNADVCLGKICSSACYFYSKMKAIHSQAWMQVWVSAVELFLLWQRPLGLGGSSLDWGGRNHDDCIICMLGAARRHSTMLQQQNSNESDRLRQLTLLNPTAITLHHPRVKIMLC